MTNWQKLCEQITPLIGDNVTEDLFHRLFEAALRTIFNWDNSNIHHKMQVPMGRETKEADIVLTDNNYGIVIEMKKPSVILGEKEAGQLTSYMRILGHKFGFLIGQEFCVFYDDDTSSNLPIKVASFGFDANNADGISLCNILDKNICSSEKLKEYAVMRIKRMQTQQEIEQLKTELINNKGEKIKEIIKTKLISDGYDENYIKDIVENIVVGYKPVNNQSPTTVQSAGNTSASDEHRAKDTTKYQFMGAEHGKNRLVLAVINDYVRNHDNCTLETLKTIFPKELQGGLGVVDTFEKGNEIYTNTKIARFFLHDRIQLNNGQQIVVCNQWGIGNINRFINKAREIGYIIEEIE
ncbi:MAG: type I restriction enzyme HsdR N-terminal domain-containing protein [Treponema sp.]|jgi:hypothetical protein|nr:type I restriction enzyme HsdR N-terminal domain-containing protein [Treponema sp.]